MYKSIATIQAPEFINLQPLDINPLMSKCEIKVFYLGENRNHSFITKDVATEMAKTLRGAPIVGYFKTDKEDFADHGQQVVIDDEGIKFNCLTRPYGFVSPDAEVWFQQFEDTDEFGNKEVREYLMTTGYLWTGQYEECNVAIEEGRPHSMELDEETLKGHWATNSNNNMDFFIINDAIFSKLCILGEDVEPCFEGSSVTAPNISTSFSKMDDGFRKTLFTMMKELEFALQGGKQMEPEIKNVELEPEVVDTVEPTTEDQVQDANNAPEDFSANDDEKSPSEEVVEEALEEGDEENSEYAKKKEEEKEDEEDEDSDTQTDEPSNEPESDDEEKNEDEDEDEKKKKYELLETEFSALKEKYEALEKEYEILVAFKNEIEDARKDEMIKKFCFLSDEDKKEVIENKSKYTIDEIESKLSVICVRKKVNFDLDDNSKNDIKIEEAPIFTYSMGNDGVTEPAWVTAVKNTQNKK